MNQSLQCTSDLVAVRAAQTRLAAAKSKAEAVVGQEDLSERGKAREIEKLYAKARAGKGAKKGKPTRAQKRHAKGPPLDGRMRADKRQVRALRALVLPETQDLSSKTSQ